MSSNKNQIRYLLKAYLDNTLREDEFQELKSILSKSDYHIKDLIDELWSEAYIEKPIEIPSDLMYQRIIEDQKILLNTDFKEERITISVAILKGVGVIAALLCISLSLYFFLPNKELNKNEFIADIIHNSVILPGGDKAILTLEDGKEINLSEVESGDLVTQLGTRVIKSEDGSIVYQADAMSIPKRESYNTIKTPKGGQFRLVLPDGTTVWLNAASSLRYPTNFAESKRIVELVGEAYFEVKSSKSSVGTRKPFIVKSRNQTIEVLGTHFNVNNYDNLAKTTLIEGSVRVYHESSNRGVLPSYTLKLNEQSIIRPGSNSIEVNNVDPINIVSWKNGYFSFDRAKITDVMSTIARWYNIEVEYEGDMANKVFVGTLSRFEDFEKLLETIELTGAVRFKVEGRRVIVM